MKKLCICIPTYKRPECLEHILCTSVEWVKEYDVDYFICDTSSTNETMNVIDAYNGLYGSHLIYRRLADYKDKTTDLKVAECFRELVDYYEYIHLCGDGLVLQLPGYFALLDGALEEGFDIVHFNPSLQKERNVYSSGLEFAKENGWYATYYGATTTSSRLINKANYDSLLNNLRNTGFMYWFGMLTAVASDNEKIIAFNTFPLTNNPFKPTNSSYQPGKFVNFWVTGWTKVIDALPAYYNEIKPLLKRDMGKHGHLYNRSNLVKLRLSDNLEWSQVRGLKSQFKQVADTPYYLISLVSLTPKSVIRCGMNAKKKLRELVKGR